METRTYRFMASRCLALVIGGAVIYALWCFLVGRRVGQVLDEVAMRSFALWGSRWGQWPKILLRDAFWWVVIAFLVCAALAALARRNYLLLFKLAGFNLLAAGASQTIKYVLFTRPDLEVGYSLYNSLPSGHTTIFAAAGLSLVVASRGARKTVLAGGAGILTAAAGALTVVAQWHRPADVYAAVVLAGALAYAFFRGQERRARTRADLYASLGVALGVVLTLAGAAIWACYWQQVRGDERAAVSAGSPLVWKAQMFTDEALRAGFAQLNSGTLLLLLGLPLLVFCLVARASVSARS